MQKDTKLGKQVETLVMIQYNYTDFTKGFQCLVNLLFKCFKFIQLQIPTAAVLFNS